MPKKPDGQNLTDGNSGMMRGFNVVVAGFSGLKIWDQIDATICDFRGCGIPFARDWRGLGHGFGRRERHSFWFTAITMKLAQASTTVLHSEI
jgi:hypothetical protein